MEHVRQLRWVQFPDVVAREPPPPDNFLPLTFGWYTSSGYKGTNWIVPGDNTPTGDLVLGMLYPGSGWGTLSTQVAHLGWSGQSFQIDFFDDGSKDLGVLVLVLNGAGNFCSIGVNDNVSPGQYYFRTDQSNGNRGTIIQAARNGMAATGNWHRFRLATSSRGCTATVDGFGTGGMDSAGDPVVGYVRADDHDRSDPVVDQLGQTEELVVLRQPAPGPAHERRPASFRATACSPVPGGPSYAVASDNAGTYIYSPTSDYVPISCPMQNLSRGGSVYPTFSYVRPERLTIEDNYSSSYANDFFRRARLARNGVVTVGHQLSTVNRDFPTQVQAYLDRPASDNTLYAVSDRSAAAIMGWLPPMKNGKRSKLYDYSFRSLP